MEFRYAKYFNRVSRGESAVFMSHFDSETMERDKMLSTFHQRAMLVVCLFAPLCVCRLFVCLFVCLSFAYIVMRLRDVLTMALLVKRGKKAFNTYFHPPVCRSVGSSVRPIRPFTCMSISISVKWPHPRVLKSTTTFQFLLNPQPHFN